MWSFDVLLGILLGASAVPAQGAIIKDQVATEVTQCEDYATFAMSPQGNPSAGM